jgi:hypothetical protein
MLAGTVGAYLLEDRRERVEAEAPPGSSESSTT